jgi:hypothetical protein
MSDAMEFVVVYRYRYWDEDKREMVTSSSEATLPCIKDGLGVPILESGRKVPRSAVDNLGRLIEAGQQGETQHKASPGDR